MTANLPNQFLQYLHLRGNDEYLKFGNATIVIPTILYYKLFFLYLITKKLFLSHTTYFFTHTVLQALF